MERRCFFSPGFVFYDFHQPEDLPEAVVASSCSSGLVLLCRRQALRGAFSFVLIDPPFITREALPVSKLGSLMRM